MSINDYLFNLVPSPEDERDFRIESIYPDDVKLPRTLDLRPDLQPVRDQGRQGTCSAQTAATIKEWHELKDYGFKGYMSPQFIYNLRPNTGQSGMNPRETMDILYKVGVVYETVYPYNTFSTITQKLRDDASRHKIERYAKINTVDAMKKALFADGPCYIAFPVFNANKQQFWLPDYPRQSHVGGHAVTVVGYTTDSFIIRNSWGIRWGDRGHCYFPFSQWGMQWEAWTAIDADSSQSVLNRKVKYYNSTHNKFTVKNFISKIKSKIMPK